MNHLRLPRPVRSVGLAAALLVPLGACGLFDSSSGGGGSSFAPAVAARAQTPDSPFLVSGRWLVYQASEARTGAFGTDFNLDGDRTDSVAAVVDMLGGGEFLPGNPGRFGYGVAAEEIAVLDDQVYVIADEDEDGFNWNGNGSTTDLVLLHWSLTSPTLTLVATLDQASPVSTLVSNGRLYFVIEDDPAASALAAGETTLHYVSTAAPTMPVLVLDENPARTLHPRLMAVDEGLLFVLNNEGVDSEVLNGDGDMFDGLVLALVDGTNPAAVVRNVGLAIDFDTDPVRALSTGAGDWLVAFPVDEFDEGRNLNDPALFPMTWQPTACVGLEDVDLNDNSLHFLHFAAWVADPANNPPVNTGLVGRTAVLAIPGSGGSPGFVATITQEEDEGECSLNGDGDPVPATTPGDPVFRYVEAIQPAGGLTDVQVDPIVDPALIVALETGIESNGVSDLGGRFLVVVDEGADGRSYDGFTGIVSDLVGWLDPSVATPEWTFNHGPVGAPSFAGTDWMSPRDDRNTLPVGEAFLPMTFQESVFMQPINPPDADENDTVPAFAFFDPTDASGDLDFKIFQIALATSNPHVAVLNGWALFPVEESADFRDWNFDGARNDVVIVAAEIANPSNAFFVTTLRNNNAFFRDPQWSTDGDVGIAFRVEEAFVGLDLNGDGDQSDYIVRWLVL